MGLRLSNLYSALCHKKSGYFSYQPRMMPLFGYKVTIFKYKFQKFYVTLYPIILENLSKRNFHAFLCHFGKLMSIPFCIFVSITDGKYELSPRILTPEFIETRRHLSLSRHHFAASFGKTCQTSDFCFI